MNQTALFIIKKDFFQGLEGQSAAQTLRRLAEEGDNGGTDLYEIDKGCLPTIADILAYGDYDVFTFIYGNVLITGEGVGLLTRAAIRRHDLIAVAPVMNLSSLSAQFQPPPFFYQTIPAFRWAVEEIYRKFQDEVVEADEIDDVCFAVKRDFVKNLPRDALLSQLPEVIRRGNCRYGIVKGAYVHRYGDLYESAREDLLPLVPLGSRDILDIGCANGLFGERLKRRQECRVTGVDSDGALLAIAQNRIDKVIAGDIEKLIEHGIPGQFDCIVCGDVLEHLNDPWQVVRELRRYLNERGTVVASVPNVANWAIIYEMLKGRWDYVPFTILSGTHIRFFTKETVKECFEDAGYQITNLYSSRN
jgi:2-polyprenyl-3-methyl-5-hydroxy-6-metoxy-1,4-benzoquinol methylase